MNEMAEEYDEEVKSNYLQSIRGYDERNIQVFAPKVDCANCTNNYVCCSSNFAPKEVPVEEWSYCEWFDPQAKKCKHHNQRPAVCVAFVCEGKTLLPVVVAVEMSPKGIAETIFVMEMLGRYFKDRTDVSFVVAEGTITDKVVTAFAQINGRIVQRVPIDWERFKTGAGKVKSEKLANIADYGLFFQGHRDKIVPDLIRRFEKRGKLYYMFKTDNRGKFT